MSIGALNWAFDCELSNAGMKLTLLALANYANEDGTAYPSQKALAIKTSMTDRSVRSQLAALEKLGLIRRDARKRANGFFTSDFFQLNVGAKPNNSGTPSAEKTLASSSGKFDQRKNLPTEINDSIQRKVLHNPAEKFSAQKEPPLTTTITKGNHHKAQAMLAALNVSETIAADFIELRKTKKAAITQTALNGIEREASKAGFSVEDALRTCCERGWTGFKAEWVLGDAAKSVKGSEGTASQAKEGARARLFGGLNHA
jgi:Helix-turn-helix domain